MKVTCFLDTTADLFARWLEYYTCAACPLNFPTEQGEIFLMGAEAPDHTAGPTSINMDAYHVMSSGEDSKVGMWLGRVISFTVVPLTSDRIEVTAECNSPTVVEYFKELLTAIEERWPGKSWRDMPLTASQTDAIAELDKLGVPKRIRRVLNKGATQGDAPVGRLLIFPDHVDVIAESEVMEYVNKSLAETAEPIAKRLGTPTPPTLPAEEGAAKRRGGRPRNADDDWACRQVWKERRARGEVYKEWRERIGDRHKRLADPWDSFTKATSKKRWEKLQGENKGEEKE